MIRKLMPAKVTVLGEREVEVRISTATRARDGHILVPSGVELEAYQKNPVVLWNHDTDEPPIGRASQITVEGDEIVERIEFAPAGLCKRADEVCGLSKAGFINGVSVGFEPLEGDPIEAGKPLRGMRFRRWEMVESSFCCVPVDPEALVTQRAASAEDWKCGASRTLPVEDSDDWDGSAAEASVFAWAGGDDFDPAKARKAFLAYNAAKPKLRGSYKLPIAHVLDGRLQVPKGAIRAAASRLSGTDIPEGTKKSAQAVIDHYEEKAGMADKGKKGADRAVALPRGLRSFTPSHGRELYHVARLGECLAQLGYLHWAAQCEADVEGDESEVPAQLLEALEAVGVAFKNQSAEECDELLELAKEIGGDDEEGDDGERAWVNEGGSIVTRALRIGMLRAGRKISAATAKQLGRAVKHNQRAQQNHKQLGKDHTAGNEHLEAAQDAHEKATAKHGELGEALEAAKAEPDKAPEHVARALKLHRAVAGHHEAIGEAHGDLEEAHNDADDAHAAVGRAMEACGRCMRAMTEGAEQDAEDEDGDSRVVQTSKGTEESTGSDGGRAGGVTHTRGVQNGDFSLRSRQADLEQLERSLA